jgi:hypothetical protein
MKPNGPDLNRTPLQVGNLVAFDPVAAGVLDPDADPAPEDPVVLDQIVVADVRVSRRCVPEPDAGAFVVSDQAAGHGNVVRLRPFSSRNSAAVRPVVLPAIHR